jgi:putative cell wall-binding protein
MPARAILSRLGAALCGLAVVAGLVLPAGSVLAAEPSVEAAARTIEGAIETAAPAGRVNMRAAAGLGPREPTNSGPSLPFSAARSSDDMTASSGPTSVPLARFSGPPDLTSSGFAGLASGSLPATWSGDPPSSGVAVGPYDVIQTTSSGFRFSDRAGRGSWEVTYADFLGQSGIVAVDGRVAWDDTHRRWLAVAGIACGSSAAGNLVVALSETTDPQWFWTYWLIPFGNWVPAQPTIGTSTDKIVVTTEAWSVDSCLAPNHMADQSRILVVDWSQILKLGYLDYFGTTFWQQQEVPEWMPWRAALADPVDPVAAAYAIGRSWHSPEDVRLWLATITGTVATGINLSTKQLPDVAPTALPGRYTDLVRRGSELFMVAGDTCDTNLAGVTAPCVRVSSVPTSGMAWLQDFVVRIEGQDVSRGAIEVAGDGTLHVVFTARPSTPQAGVGASTWAVHQAPTAPPGTVSPPTLIARGAYLPSGDVLGGVARLAPDPVDPHAIWQADAYGGAPGGGWTTWISQLRTGVPTAPTGALSIEAGRPATHATWLRVSAIPTSGTQLLLSNASATSEGRLSKALQVEPGHDLAWDLAASTYGGSTAAGDRRVYFQWGDGAGGWSAVQSALIRYAGPPTVVRLAGADRYATAAAIAKANYAPGVPAVYIATGLNFPDALAGAGAAGRQGAPVLLVSPTGIPASTADALRYLKPARIVVLGGTIVVPPAIQSALAAYVPGGASSVSRLAGPDRYATAAAISKATYAPGVNEVLIATGRNFPDALAGTAVAARDGAPMLLVSGTSIPSATAQELSRLKPHRIVILGGELVVSPGVAAGLRAYTDGGVFRVAGPDRYATAAAISWVWFGEHPAVGFVATGRNFPDALAGGSLAGHLASPLILVPGTSIPASTSEVLDYLEPYEFDVLGGYLVVSDGVMTSLKGYVGP